MKFHLLKISIPLFGLFLAVASFISFVGVAQAGTVCTDTSTCATGSYVDQPATCYYGSPPLVTIPAGYGYFCASDYDNGGLYGCTGGCGNPGDSISYSCPYACTTSVYVCSSYVQSCVTTPDYVAPASCSYSNYDTWGAGCYATTTTGTIEDGGSFTINNQNPNYTYTSGASFTCSNGSWVGPVPNPPSCNAVPVVSAPTSASISASPNPVGPNQDTTISWGATGATSYTVTLAGVEYPFGSTTSRTGTPASISLGIGSYPLSVQACNSAGCVRSATTTITLVVANPTPTINSLPRQYLSSLSVARNTPGRRQVNCCAVPTVAGTHGLPASGSETFSVTACDHYRVSNRTQVNLLEVELQKSCFYMLLVLLRTVQNFRPHG